MSDPNAARALEVIDLARRFGDVVALDDVSFRLEVGEMVGFVGPNGAGKTTAMRIALGVLQADAGEVRWLGRPVDAETRRRFGYMLTILIVASFFIGLSATQDPDSTLAVVASLLPFSSPLVMPTRIVLGDAAPWEVVASLAISLASTAALILIATTIYSRGVAPSRPRSDPAGAPRRRRLRPINPRRAARCRTRCPRGRP